AATLISGIALAYAGIFWGRRIALHAAGRGHDTP
ncbi:chromosome condensation protein CrcB, partial [Priestia megaterium]